MARTKTQTSTFTSSAEFDLEVEYEVSGRHIAATRLDPEEWPEVEIAAVFVGGRTCRINILDALDADTLATLTEQAEEEVRESDVRRYEDAAEARACHDEDMADARRDERMVR